MSRRQIPAEVQTAVLLSSRRRCCICYGLNRTLDVRQGQLAHLDQDPENNSEENLAFICLDHHDWYDTKPSQSKGLTIYEVKHYRSELYAALLRKDSKEAEASTGFERKRASPEPVFEPVQINTWTRPRPDYPDFLGLSDSVPEAPRIFLTETVEEILDAIKRMPPLSRKVMATAAYVGRWIGCRATILSIDEGDNCYRVWAVPLDSPERWTSVSLTFPLSWRPDVETLRPEDRIYAEGQIRQVDATIELVYPAITEHWRRQRH